MRIRHTYILYIQMEGLMSELQDYLDEALQKCNIAKAENDNNVYSNIAMEIVKTRMEKGITQKQLADMCGIQQSNISRLEKGVYNPSIQLLIKIAETLGKKIKIEFI